MRKKQEFVRMAKYALVGVMNTGVDFAVFCALVYGAGVASVWAQVASYGIALANSYVLNRKWTFQARGERQLGDVVRFVAVNAVSFGLSTAALLGLESAGMESAIAKGCSVFVSMVANYAGYRLWVFRAQPGGERAG
ncbi:GtrA family protein [Cohnella sp. GCM10027633]|uniref:GtrA family protein n=1 Tax=unclassified Cohnella TaxID=2636738 RepID=UPI0036289EA9